MKNSQNLLCFTFLFLIISSFASVERHISISPATATTSSPAPGHRPVTVDPEIKKWCNSTDYPELCVATIGPSLSGKPELFHALQIAITSSVETTKMAIAIGRKIANSPVLRAELRSLMQDSLNSFSDALDNFKQAQDALPLRDWGTVMTMLSGALTDFGDIEDFLVKQNVPALIEFLKRVKKMTSNCLALCALLHPVPGI